MKNYISIIFLPVFIFLTACEEGCDEPDVQRINGLYFEFDQEGSDGFTEEELNNVFFVRYVPLSEPLVADTLYINGIYPEGFGKFIINDNFPFQNFGAPYFISYSYLIVENITGYVGNVENIVLKGEYDGECGYNNLQKSFFFNGDSLDMGGVSTPFIISR